jgi:iron complex outermembrane receptor protein
MRIAIAATIACLSIIGVTATAQVHAAVRKHTEIPPEQLDLALRTLAKDRGFQVVYLSEDVRALQTRGAIGDFTIDEALKKLLSDSRLEYKFVDENTVSIFPKTIPTSALEDRNSTSASVREEESSGSSPKSSSEKQLRLAQVDQGTAGPQTVGEKQSAEKKKKEDELTEIVVTGTHIHGAGIVGSPPMITITREDIQNGGFATAQDLFEALPQNYHAMNNDGQYATGTLGFAGYNLQAASLIDLYGLGPESTLVLLNGMRQAGTIEGRGVDVSVIPLSILQQVDVATGGRSAIYGSDAVAGVVNFTTRHDFEGAETQAVYGGTAHGADHLQVSQTVGMKTDRGGFVAAYDFSKQDLFNLVATGLTGTGSYGITPLKYSSQPDKQTQAAYLAGHYFIVDSVELYGDALYTHDDAYNPKVFDFAPTLDFDSQRSNSNQYNVSAGLRAALIRDWKADVSANYSAEATTINDIQIYGGVPNPSFEQPKTSVGSVAAVADGPVAQINGNDFKVALGADYRREGHIPGAQDSQKLSRTVSAAFLEGSLPLVKDGPLGIRRLELSGAGRYDHYSDFGGTTNKQFGALWAPLDLFAVRTSYATSFHAPDLYTEGELSTAQVVIATDPHVPSGSSPVLEWGGGNLALKPETAKTWTTGVDILPPIPSASVAKISVDYIDIRYTNRIGAPGATVPYGGELESDILLPYINRNPSAAEIAYIQSITLAGIQNNTGLPYNPATQTLLQAFPGLVLLDARFTNIATETLHALDFKGDFRFDTGIGKISAGFNGSRTLSHHAQNIAGTPTFSLINDVGEPVGFRIRTNTGIERGPLSLFAYVNFTRSYPNTYATPPDTIASWTTVDMSLRFKGSAIAKSGLLHGFEANISADNIFDRRPPPFPQAGWGMFYDPANANPFGRILSLRLLEHW